MSAIDGLKLHKSIDLAPTRSPEKASFPISETNTPNPKLGGFSSGNPLISGGQPLAVTTSVGGNSNNNNLLARSSIFSRSTLNSNTSFMFRSLHRARSGGPVPKVSIQQLIKKKADLYWDEALASSFDDLLDSGYTLVVNKKHERDALKQIEDNLRGDIAGLEKEIIPEINRLFNTKEAVKHLRDLREKYESEIEALKREIQDERTIISDRVSEIEEENQSLINKMKSLELANNDLRSEIIVAKTIHKKEKEDLEKTIRLRKEEQSKLVDRLTDLRSMYERKKKEQAEKLRKMENKSKMFLGILKHQRKNKQ